MQRLEVSGAVRPLYGSLGFKGLSAVTMQNISSKLGILTEICLAVSFVISLQAVLRRRHKANLMPVLFKRHTTHAKVPRAAPGLLRELYLLFFKSCDFY